MLQGQRPEPIPFPVLHAAWAAQLPCSPHSTWRAEGFYMGKEEDKEIKEESFMAVIDPLYLANHWAITICEDYIGKICLH